MIVVQKETVIESKFFKSETVLMASRRVFEDAKRKEGIKSTEEFVDIFFNLHTKSSEKRVNYLFYKGDIFLMASNNKGLKSEIDLIIQASRACKGF